MPSFVAAVLTILCGAVFGLLCKTSYGRHLLEKYPKFFSAGLFSKEGPSREMAEGTTFALTLIGKGWNRKVGSRYERDPERKVIVKVCGKNIGYGSTSECLVQSALTILEENDIMPGEGGVLTPGYAFGETTLVKRLHENGVTFVSDTINMI